VFFPLSAVFMDVYDEENVVKKENRRPAAVRGEMLPTGKHSLSRIAIVCERMRAGQFNRKRHDTAQ